jgi:hypothetical protein
MQKKESARREERQAPNADHEHIRCSYRHPRQRALDPPFWSFVPNKLENFLSLFCWRLQTDIHSLFVGFFLLMLLLPTFIALALNKPFPPPGPVSMVGVRARELCVYYCRTYYSAGDALDPRYGKFLFPPLLKLSRSRSRASSPTHVSASSYVSSDMYPPPHMSLSRFLPPLLLSLPPPQR